MSVNRSAAVLAAALLLAGCGEAGSEPDGGSAAPAPSESVAPTPSESVAPTPEWTGDVIPDGSYTKTATFADAKRLGLPRDVAATFIGPDGEFHVELRIAGDYWSQFGDDDGGTMKQGDSGTVSYDADGNWVVASDSSGCPGCGATFAWSLKGDRLTLTMLDTTEVGDPDDILGSRLVMEGRFTRQ